MFTGIIEEIGKIKNITRQGQGLRIQIEAKTVLNDLEIDQSVAVNGVCLTVVETGYNNFSADAVAETISKSTLAKLNKNEQVNLERALRLQDRLGGHIVQGHVDGIGKIINLLHKPEGSILKIEIPSNLNNYTIPKGSIAIEGISLTIAEKQTNILTVAVIPHTMKQTILQYKNKGDYINLEVDFFAKYIEQFMNKTSETKITKEWLNQKGF